MKLFNLPRAGGKSMRMIYASEFNNVPILCVNEVSKGHLLHLSRIYKINIPEPITVNQFITRRYKNKGCCKILVDEAIFVLQAIIKANGVEMIGCAMSDEKNERITEQYINERGNNDV